jgi:hypothetical protein
MDLRIFTPSAAGAAAFDAMNIAAILAQLRAKNNKIVQENADTEGNINQALAAFNSAIANNQAAATQAEAIGSFVEAGGIATFQVGGKIANHFSTQKQMSPIQQKLQTIKTNTATISNIENKPANAVARDANADESEKLKNARQNLKKINFEEEIGTDLKQDIETVHTDRSPESKEDYKAFKKRLTQAEKEQNKELKRLDHAEDRLNNHLDVASRLVGSFGQAGARTSAAKSQAANAAQEAAKVTSEYMQQVLRTLDQMVSDLGNALESSRQSLMQTLLGGLAAANRA